MKLEIILQEVGSITIEDELNRSDKDIRKLTAFALEQLRSGPPARKAGFGD